MNPQLTEKEAWLKTANFFRYNRKRYRQVNGYGLITKHKSQVIGLCDYIYYLYNTLKVITFSQRDEMMGKIKRAYPHITRYDYVWPANKEGHKARVKFCLERAKEL